MNRARGLVAAVLVLLALGAGGTATVSAHAVLESSTPAAGAVLEAAPTDVELVFSENVGTPAALSVLGPDGAELPVGDLAVVDDTMRRSVDAGGAGPGTYTISYQVTSADGHPVSGSLGFSVGDAGGAPVGGAPTVTPDDPTDASPIVVAVLGAVLAIALGVALAATRRLIVAGTEPHTDP